MTARNLLLNKLAQAIANAPPHWQNVIARQEWLGILTLLGIL